MGEKSSRHFLSAKRGYRDSEGKINGLTVLPTSSKYRWLVTYEGQEEIWHLTYYFRLGQLSTHGPRIM